MADGNGSNPTTLAVPSSIARLNYFYGQLLSQADLKAEQSYHVLLRRLMQRETFGVGTVAGLRVKEGTLDGTILIEPGLALDAFGRELLLASEQCLEIVPAALPSAENDIPDSSYADMADELSTLFGGSIGPSDVEALEDRLVAVGMTEAEASLADLAQILGRVAVPVPFTLAPGQTLAMWLFDALVGTTYVSLSYLERGADLAPAVLDSAYCGDSPCHPTRLREGVRLSVSDTLPTPPADPYQRAYASLSQCFLDEDNPASGPTPVPPVLHSCGPCLTEAVLGAWIPMPSADLPCSPTSAPPITLAAAYWSRYARVPPASPPAPRLLAPIDNRSFRALAPSPVLTRALFDAVTQCATPVQIPPTIVSIEPAQGMRLTLPATGTAFVRARCTGPMKVTPLGEGWEVVFYPLTPADPVVTWNAASNLKAITFAVDAADPHWLLLGLPVASGFAAGTYVWRLNPTGSVAVVARATGTVLDGEPHPVTAVPSGNGKPGGTFEARFYIAS